MNNYNQKYDITPDQIKAMTVIKKINIYQNGFEIVRGMRWPTPKPEAPKERRIYEMSRKSKANLAHVVANSDIKWKSLLTLTYGDFFIPVDGRELKRQLNIFLKSFRQRFDQEYLWFMEFTKREHPHFHIFTTVQPNVIDRYWLANRWAKITVTDVVKDLRAQAVKELPTGWEEIPLETIESERDKVIKVHKHPKTWQEIRKKDGATRYALKYASKQSQKLVPVNFGNCGRFWGTSRGVDVVLKGSLVVGVDISEEEVEEFFSGLLPNDLPLLPRFLFIPNALSKIQGGGFTLRELNGNEPQEKPRE